MSKRKAIPTMSSTQVAKRLRKVEAMARANRPEMQTRTFTLNGSLNPNVLGNIILTSIEQGDSIEKRSGDEIRIWRIEIRGLSDDTLDHYLIQCHTTSEPVVGTFNSEPGAFIVDSENNAKFTEWKHYRNFSGSGSLDPLRMVQKFNGIRVHYNGIAATDTVRNKLVYTVLNRTGTVRNVQVCARVWFTDA